MGNYLIQKPDKQIFLSLFLTIFFLIDLPSQNSEDLFQSVFGESSNAIQTIPVPLYINNQYIDDLIITVDPQIEIINLEATKILNMLTPWLAVCRVDKPS